MCGSLIYKYIILNSCSSLSSNNDTVETGSFYRPVENGHNYGDSHQADQADVLKHPTVLNEVIQEDEIIFHEGWTPTHYE